MDIPHREGVCLCNQAPPIKIAIFGHQFRRRDSSTVEVKVPLLVTILTPTTVAGVKRLFASVCSYARMSVFPQDYSKMNDPIFFSHSNVMGSSLRPSCSDFIGKLLTHMCLCQV